jgi:hypothetical protein
MAPSYPARPPRRLIPGTENRSRRTPVRDSVLCPQRVCLACGCVVRFDLATVGGRLSSTNAYRRRSRGWLEAAGIAAQAHAGRPGDQGSLPIGRSQRGRVEQRVGSLPRGATGSASARMLNTLFAPAGPERDFTDGDLPLRGGHRRRAASRDRAWRRESRRAEDASPGRSGTLPGTHLRSHSGQNDRSRVTRVSRRCRLVPRASPRQAGTAGGDGSELYCRRRRDAVMTVGLSRPDLADVVVIGGGIAVACAYYLSRAGVAVQVLERLRGQRHIPSLRWPDPLLGQVVGGRTGAGEV